VSSNEWYTPSKYIEAAREVMGSIDLDPASCELANQVVKAAKYYTKEDNGLMHPWYGNVWLNPPFGKTEGWKCSNLEAFTRRLVCFYATNVIRQAIYLVPVDTSTKWYHLLFAYPICFPQGRISFSDKKGNGQYPMSFIYFGPNEQKFIEVFSKFRRIAKAIDTPKPLPVTLELPF